MLNFSTTLSSARMKNCLEKLLPEACYLLRYGPQLADCRSFGEESVANLGVWFSRSCLCSDAHLNPDCSAAMNVECSRMKGLLSHTM